MFLDHAAYGRLWRRILHRYPFVRAQDVLRRVEGLHRADPELTYDALKALGELDGRLAPAEVRAYFAQLTRLQPAGEFAAEDLLHGLAALGARRAWRWVNHGLSQPARPIGAHLAGATPSARALLDGLRGGAWAHDMEPVLSYYADALGGPGRPLRFLPEDAQTFPEDALRLPDHVAAYAAPAPGAEDPHFLLYKWLITHEICHQQGGTYRPGGADAAAGRVALAARLQAFADPALGEALFHLLEDVRVEAQLLRQYPGFRALRSGLLDQERPFRPTPEAPADRLLEALLQQCHWGAVRFALPGSVAERLAAWSAEAQALTRDRATVDDALQLCEAVYPQLRALAGEAVACARLVPLFPHEPPLQMAPPAAPRRRPHTVARPLTAERHAAHEAEADEVGGEAVPPGVWQYDEWDYRSGQYRTRWCALHEPAPSEGAPDDVPAAPPHVAQVRRAFEWLAQEDWRRQKRQLEGDELDVDAWVAGEVDRRTGHPLPEKLYTQRLRSDRDLCAAVLLDQSDSTARLTPAGEPVIAVEREALRYLCEALEALRDEYALFAYSGDGRGRVECYRLKGFDEPYGLTVQRRLGALQPLAQNRDGCALRHVAAGMQARRARTKLLLHVTDGRPWDHGYTQRYALEDTRRAVQEARSAGIKVFGVICDPHAPAQLRQTYGPGRAVILREVGGLSELLLGAYRRLTT